jgi:hypothetical protein
MPAVALGRSPWSGLLMAMNYLLERFNMMRMLVLKPPYVVKLQA